MATDRRSPSSRDATKKRRLAAVALLAWAVAGVSAAQSPSLIGENVWKAIIEESSGELALRHFADLLDYSGWAPSRGAEQTAQYLVERARELGLSDIRLEKFPSDGKRFVWAFRTEPLHRNAGRHDRAGGRHANETRHRDRRRVGLCAGRRPTR